ncbi:unnamed protein product [Sympodiomycopsis kandeliae]
MSSQARTTSEDVASASSASAGMPSDSNEPGRQVEPGREDMDEEQGKSRGPSSSTQDPARNDTSRPSRSDRTLRHLSVLGLLMFASIWGTLAREGLVALNTYDGSSITPVIWAQAVGCLIMGWTVANKQAIDDWYPPAFIMLGTGFCGSVTTFSSWISQVFQAYGNQHHYNRHGLHNVMDALTQTFATLGLSLAALAAGMSIAKVIPASSVIRLLSLKKPQREETRKSETIHKTPARSTKKLDLFCFIILGLGFWIGAAFLSAFQTHPQFRPTTFAIVFSPPGAILRWYLSRWNSASLSKRWPYWPLGTFTANMLATAILAAVFVGQHYGPSGTHQAASTVLQCHILYALQEGLCGCLSTVSTFAVELRNIKPRRRAVGYAVGSYTIGIAICVLIIGAPWWSRGMDGSCNGIVVYHG